MHLQRFAEVLWPLLVWASAEDVGGAWLPARSSALELRAGGTWDGQRLDGRTDTVLPYPRPPTTTCATKSRLLVNARYGWTGCLPLWNSYDRPRDPGARSQVSKHYH